MKDLEILARLYDFLATWPSADFARICHSAHVEPEVRACLRALADARRSLEKRYSASGTSSARNRMSDEPPYERRIRELVLNRKYHHTTEELTRHLNSIGLLSIKFNKRDGRKRMSDKLLRNLKKLSSKDRHECLTRLFAALPKSETSEWFEAIRGER